MKRSLKEFNPFRTQHTGMKPLKAVNTQYRCSISLILRFLIKCVIFQRWSRSTQPATVMLLITAFMHMDRKPPRHSVLLLITANAAELSYHQRPQPIIEITVCYQCHGEGLCVSHKSISSQDLFPELVCADWRNCGSDKQHARFSL